MVFNTFDEESACWSYREGVLSMKVTRKGAVINTLDANWLDLTTFYYKQGLSLVDAFVSWETPKGEFTLVIHPSVNHLDACQNCRKCCLSSTVAYENGYNLL